ncbi:MAG: hypothetical protein H6723_11175 [Sandaracinus sp.]|nr:hypothetical protein [Sandaracinus sp.]
MLALLISLQPSLHVPFLLDAWYDTSRPLIEGPRDSYREQLKFLEEGRKYDVTVLERSGSLRLFNDGRPESGISIPETPARRGAFGARPVADAVCIGPRASHGDRSSALATRLP